MVAVFLKEEGRVIEISQSYKEKYPYLDEYIAFLSFILNELNNLKRIDIEVNLIEYGKIGSELLLDNRLNTEKLKRDIDSINNLSAIAIYFVGIYGDLLLEEYKEQKICYIQLQQTYPINMIRIAFHELQHFSGRFIPSEWQIGLGNGVTHLNYENTIKAYIRMGLNEYYANLYAFSKCLDLINDMVKRKLSNSLIEIFNKALIEKIPSYLSNLSKELNEFIATLRWGEINNVRILNPKAELIQFLWSRFFKEIYYFLGGWKIYEDRELTTSLIQETWDDFINEIQEIGLNDMIILLNSFKNLMLEDFENEYEIVESVELLFLKYYREELESDFSLFL